MHAIVTRLTIPPDYSLKRSLSSFSSGRRDPTVRVDGNQLTFSLLTPDGAVVVSVVPKNDRQLRVEVVGDGAPWLEPFLYELFGLQDAPSEFAPQGRVLQLLKQYPGTHLPRLPVVFHRLVQIVLHQLVTWEEAVLGWQTVTRRFGEEAPGDSGLLVGPTPETLTALAYYDLVDCGILPRQARLILKLAAEHRRIERAWARGDSSLLTCLSQFSGIGEWTLQTFKGSCLADPDAVITGDYGLPHSVCWFFRRQERGTDEEMLELLEPYRGHRYRLQQLLMHAGVKAPRYGPKMPLRAWR